MALDEANHRLFVGCRDGKMVVLDTTSGKEPESVLEPVHAIGFRPSHENRSAILSRNREDTAARHFVL